MYTLEGETFYFPILGAYKCIRLAPPLYIGSRYATGSARAEPIITDGHNNIVYWPIENSTIGSVIFSTCKYRNDATEVVSKRFPKKPLHYLQVLVVRVTTQSGR